MDKKITLCLYLAHAFIGIYCINVVNNSASSVAHIIHCIILYLSILAFRERNTHQFLVPKLKILLLGAFGISL